MDDQPQTKVVLVTHYFPSHGGGIEIVAMEIASRLAETGRFIIEWYASATDPPPCIQGVQPRPATAFNWTERALGLPYPIWAPHALWSMIKSIRKADVVHVHDALYFSNIVAVMSASAFHKRIVITQHIGFVPYKSRLLRTLLSLANRYMAVPMLRKGHCVAFVSPVVRRYFERLGLQGARVVTRANGVDSARFFPASSAERRALRSRLGFAPDQPVLLFVGRHVEKKGLALIRQLAGYSHTWQWALIGSGPINPREWALSNVRVLGSLPQVQIIDYYRCADLLVLPSIGEGFPLVVQEALSCGLVSAVHTETYEAGELHPDIALAASVTASDAFDAWRSVLETYLASAPEELTRRRLTAVRFAVERWSWDVAVAFYAKALSNTVAD